MSIKRRIENGTTTVRDAKILNILLTISFIVGMIVMFVILGGN